MPYPPLPWLNEGAINICGKLEEMDPINIVWQKLTVTNEGACMVGPSSPCVLSVNIWMTSDGLAESAVEDSLQLRGCLTFRKVYAIKIFGVLTHPNV